MISQAYTVDVHGYVLVYSVTSQKRYRTVLSYDDEAIARA